MPILQGKVIIVTGAGRGIGAEIAKLAAREGAKVVVNDLGCGLDGAGGSGDAARGVVEEIHAAGGTAIPSVETVATWEGGVAIAKEAMDAFGRIDGVVNNAGALRDSHFLEMDREQWEVVQTVNLWGPFFVARAAAPYLRDTGGGAYVHMTSTSGLIGNADEVNYGAAKLGVVGLSKCIALDMARFNVRSNCIAPWAHTRLTTSILRNDTEENRKRVEAIKKRMPPDKIAPLAVALLSDGAKSITGQIFNVRGNEIALYSQPRPVRIVQSRDGWTPESCVDSALPSFRGAMCPLEIASQVFNWDPI